MSGDLIRRQDAIDALKKYEELESNNFTDTSPISMMTVATIANCIEEIVNLPSAEPERRWIPVTEKLPINGVDVIVSVLDDSGDTPYRFTSVGWCITNGQYWVVDNEMCYGVIAWMPLPEPWRGE